MERSCYNIVVYCLLLFANFIDKVVQSHMVTVEAAVGESVILLCSSSHYEKDVFWRHNNTRTVYDIINGNENLDDQEAAYRRRVEGFPSEFKKGNYSIKLRDLQHSDTGTFICQIPNFSSQYVEVKTTEHSVGFKSRPRWQQLESVQTNGGVRTQSDSLLCFYVALLGLNIVFFGHLQ